MDPSDRAHRDLRPLLAPRSVAVVGASEGALGGQCLQSLVAFGFGGPIYPVNPRREKVFGRRCYPSVEALPEMVECAAISVPAAQVLPVLRQCVATGVRAAVVNSSGFAGAAGGEQGQQLQDEVAAFAAEHGLLLCGPNCQGTIAVPERAALYFGDVTGLAAAPRAGGLAIVSHSGSLMSALLRFGARRGLGFTYLVSSGNEIVLTAADYLPFLLRDEATRVVGAVLEQFRNPAAFAAAADLAVALGKPLLVLKVGRTEASRRAVRSHTGALAESTAVADAFCRDRGIVLVDSLEELCQTAQAFLKAGALAGPRLGVISPSGGTGCLVADAATAQGLTLPELAPATADAVRAVILPVGTAANPADLSGPHLPALQATAELFAASGSLDALVFAHSYANERLLDALPGVAADLPPAARPLFALFATDAGVDAAWERAAAGADLVLLRGLEPGLRAMRALVDYGALQRRQQAGERPAREPPRPRPPAPATRLATLEERAALLARLGIPLAACAVARDADAAVEAAGRLGYPVALKLDLPHKSDVGGLRLDLRSDDDVRVAYAALAAVRAGPAAGEAAVLVQPMVAGGVELLVGAHLDPHLGMVVLCGLGGIYAETLQDVALGFPPFAGDDGARLLRALRGYPLLQGARGRPPADVAAAAAALAAVARAAQAGAFESLDLNPLIVLPAGQGVVAVDCLVVLPA
ncbi:MAG TPA: acetate--CoA ligase family protein [Chloroflexota bacterium]